MIVRLGLACFLFSFLVVGAHAADPLEGSEASLVRVMAYDSSRLSGHATGFVVSVDNLLLTSAHVVKNAKRVTVIIPASGAELTASMVASDQANDLALLRVEGLGVPALLVSDEAVVPGMNIMAMRVLVGDTGGLVVQASEGSIGQLLVSGPASPKHFIEHNAMIDRIGYGGPLLNLCGEVIGVNRPDPSASSRRIRRGLEPSGVVFASDAKTILAFLSANGVQISPAPTDCATALERAESAAAEARRKAVAANEAADQAAERASLAQAQAQAQADSLASDLDQARNQTEAAKRAMELAKTAAASARAAAAAAQAEAEATAEAAIAKEQAAQETADRLEAAKVESEKLKLELGAAKKERETNKEREKWLQYGLYGTGGLVALALLIIFLRGRGAKKRQALADQKVTQAKAEAEQAKAEAERRGARFSDCLFEGVGSDGNRIVAKVSGADLAQKGAIYVGRNPTQVDLVIDDPEVSKKHAVIHHVDGELFVLDCSSTNGTLVGGVEVPIGEKGGKQEVGLKLENDSELTLGRIKLRVSFKS